MLGGFGFWGLGGFEVSEFTLEVRALRFGFRIWAANDVGFT